MAQAAIVDPVVLRAIEVTMHRQVLRQEHRQKAIVLRQEVLQVVAVLALLPEPQVAQVVQVEEDKMKLLSIYIKITLYT